MTISYNSNFIETMPFSDTCAQFSLSSNAEQTFSIPGNETIQYQAYFTYMTSSNVFICKNATPVIPVDAVAGVQQYNEFKPKKRYVRGGDVLHFITPDATAYMGVSLRQLPG